MNKKIYKSFLLLPLLTAGFLTPSCTNYTTDLNEMEKIKISQMTDIITGQSCSNNLFGGFTLPYIGDTAIKLSGDQSVMAAIKSANITKVYAVDKVTRNYFFYSKRCTIVFGKKDALNQTPETALKDASIKTNISLDGNAPKKEVPPVKFVLKKAETQEDDLLSKGNQAPAVENKENAKPQAKEEEPEDNRPKQDEEGDPIMPDSN